MYALLQEALRTHMLGGQLWCLRSGRSTWSSFPQAALAEAMPVMILDLLRNCKSAQIKMSKCRRRVSVLCWRLACAAASRRCRWLLQQVCCLCCCALLEITGFERRAFSASFVAYSAPLADLSGKNEWMHCCRCYFFPSRMAEDLCPLARLPMLMCTKDLARQQVIFSNIELLWAADSIR